MRPLQAKKPKHLSFYLGLLALVILAMFSLRACSERRVPVVADDVHSGGDTIDVAIEYSPLTFYRYADTLGGFQYDMLRSIAAAEGLKLKFHPVTSPDAALERLADGRFDIIVADIPLTANYKEQLAFTEPVFLDRQVLVQRGDSSGRTLVPDQLSLAGKRVWVPRNSPAIIRLRNLAAEIGDTIYINDSTDYGSEQLFILTALGDVDYAVVNEKTARMLAPDYPQVDVSTDISFTQFQSWLMKRDGARKVSDIDSMIVRFKATDAYRMLLQRYGIE